MSNKRVLYLIFIIIAVFSLCGGGCALLRLQTKQKISVETPPPIKHLSSSSSEVIFSVDFSTIDSAADILCFVPPGENIKAEFRHYELNFEDEKDGEASVEKFTRNQLETYLQKQVSLSDLGYMRFNRIMRLRVNKKFLIENKQVSLNRAIIALTFSPYSPPKKTNDTAFQHSESCFGKLAKILVANYSDYKRFVDPTPPFDLDNTDITWLNRIGRELNYKNIIWRKVEINTSGMYKIDLSWLKENGIDANRLHPANVKIFHRGKEVPRLIYGGFAENFTAKDSVIFYVPPPDNKYSPNAVYWLRFELDKKQSHPEATFTEIHYKPAPESSQRLIFFAAPFQIDEDKELKIHTGNFLAIKGMRWVADELKPESPYLLQFDLPYLAENVPGETKIYFNFYLEKDLFKPDVTFLVRMNEYEFPTFKFSHFQQDQQSFSLPYRILKRYNNQLSILIKTSEDKPQNCGIFFDRVEFYYPRRFVAENNQLTVNFSNTYADDLKTSEVILCKLEGFPAQTLVAGCEISNSAPPSVILLESTRTDGSIEVALPYVKDKTFFFFVPESLPGLPVSKSVNFARLSDPRHRSNFLIITHHNFLSESQRLINLKRAQGFLPLLIDVEAIYDEFNYGEESPEAIKKFLRYALTHWKPPLVEYVLLIGDATSDYKRLTRNEVINYVPTYTIVESISGDEWASDHWFTKICGTDDFDDIILGRLSINNLNDAKVVIDKIINYETRVVPGLWQSNIGYVADNSIFDDYCEVLRKEHTPPHYYCPTIYLDELTLEDNFYLPVEVVEEERAKISTAATTRIKETIDQGVAILTFYGHGSPNIWADERIWFGGDSENSDNLNLRNGAKLPFILNMTCNSGAIDYPVPKWNVCISEDFMRVPKGGAIGLYVPAGPGFTDYHKQISISFHRALFKEKFRSVGDCVVAGHYFYLLADYPREMVQMYILLGDPSLKLQLVTELFDFNVEPARVTTEQQLKFKAYGKVPRLKQGLVSFFLTDPNNNIVIEPTTRNFFNSQLEFEFSLQKPVVRGEWILRAFCQDAKHPEQMVLGKATFWIDTPYLKLTRVNKQFSNDNYTSGAEVILTAKIENPGYLDINDAIVELYKWRNNEWEKQGETLTAVPHNSTRQLNFIVHPTEGMNLYKLRLKNYFLPPDPTIEPVFEKVIELPIKRNEAQYPDIVLVSPLISLDQITSSSGAINATVSGVIYNVGNDNFTGIKCILLNEQKDILAEQTYPEDFFRELKPVNIKLSATVTRIEELKNLTLKTELTPTNTPDANPQDNSIDLNDKLLNLPDLFVSGEDISFPDPKPTEGFTVFMDVVIHNQGKGAAKNFIVAAYDNHPLQGGAILFDYMNGTASKLIPYLAPASSTGVRLRWDPVKNQGEKTIWIKVDATNKLFEENEENNIASARLYVKKKAILKPAGIFLKEQTPEEKKLGIIQLQAVVKNIGETDAHNVYVEIYKTDSQNPENLLEKVFIPEIKAGEEQIAKATWQIKPEERHLTVRPSYRIFLKGSLQRISSILPPDEVK